MGVTSVQMGERTGFEAAVSLTEQIAAGDHFAARPAERLRAELQPAGEHSLRRIVLPGLHPRVGGGWKDITQQEILFGMKRRDPGEFAVRRHQVSGVVE